MSPNTNSAKCGFGLLRRGLAERVSSERDLGLVRRGWQEMIWPIYERDHGSVFSGAAGQPLYPQSQTAVSGPMPGGPAVQANVPAHGAGVCGLDPTVHPVE